MIQYKYSDSDIRVIMKNFKTHTSKDKTQAYSLVIITLNHVIKIAY